jgi:hypothetical protein
MWFALGLITLVVAFLAALELRQSSARTGDERRLDGVAYEHGEIKPKGKVTAMYFGCAAPPNFEFALRPEGARDRWFKRIGISAERQVGDHAFDRAFYLESDDRVVGDLLAQRKDIRDGLRAAAAAVSRLGAKWVELRCHEGRVWVRLKPGSKHRPESLPRLVVPALAAFAEALRATPERADVGHRDPFIRRAAIVLAANSAVATVGVVVILRAIKGKTELLAPWTLFAAGLAPSLLMLVAFALLAMKWLGGSSRAHLVLVELLTVGTFGFATAGFGVLREIDVAFDPYAGRRHVIEHATLSYHRGRKSGSHYYLHPAGFPAPNDDSKLEIDRATYEWLQREHPTGTDVGPLTLVVRPGSLGFAWLENVEKAPTAAATPPPR